MKDLFELRSVRLEKVDSCQLFVWVLGNADEGSGKKLNRYLFFLLYKER